MGRERERMNEDARRSEEVYKQQLEQLEQNVKQLEKERNLLMVSLDKSAAYARQQLQLYWYSRSVMVPSFPSYYQ